MREEVIWETRYGRHVQLSEFDGHVDKAIFFFTILGDHDKDSATEVFDHVYAFLKQRPPSLFLNDLEHLGEMSLSTMWFVASRAKRNQPHIAKSAIFGLAPKIRTATNAVLRVAKRDDIRIFETKDEAIAWLLQD